MDLSGTTLGNMRYKRLIPLFALLAILIPAVSFPASSPEEAAKSEGEVVFYSSLNNEQITTLAEAFRRKYPSVRPSFYRGTSDRVLQRVMTEAQVGRHSVDVISAAGFQIQLLKDKGLTGKFVPADASAYEGGFRDADGQWTTLHILLNSMAYNTRLVPAAEAPKRYTDLIHPKWKGKLGVNVRDPEWFVNLQRLHGKERARELIRGLAAQNPGLQDGHNLLAQLLAAGEFHAVSNTYAHIAAREKERGAPVQWVFAEPVITYLHPVATARHAPHPNSAQLFLNFLLSKDGQSMLREQGRIPAHRGVEPKVFSLKDVKLFPSDIRLAKEYDAAAQEMRNVLGGR
jgi:iron(III) transport system substrate-binding protein